MNGDGKVSGDVTDESTGLPLTLDDAYLNVYFASDGRFYFSQDVQGSSYTSVLSCCGPRWMVSTPAGTGSRSIS